MRTGAGRGEATAASVGCRRAAGSTRCGSKLLVAGRVARAGVEPTAAVVAGASPPWLSDPPPNNPDRKPVRPPPLDPDLSGASSRLAAAVAVRVDCGKLSAAVDGMTVAARASTLELAGATVVAWFQPEG